MLNNFDLVLPFAPEKDDGDTFLYTEMLDRGRRKGNNGQRLVKTFYHRSRAEFVDQFETIRRLCDLSLVRACTRLSPRSYRRVGAQFTRMVVEASLTDNWAGMKSLYNRACGVAPVERKTWLWDVDELGERQERFGEGLRELAVLEAAIPSKKGMHYITRAFDMRIAIEKLRAAGFNDEVSVHKDNPTNLYIPDGAE